MHFAGLKAVGESSMIPLDYWEVNVGGTINILKIMDNYNCHNFVFIVVRLYMVGTIIIQKKIQLENL